MRILKTLGVATIVGSLAACSIPAPKYSPSYDNVQRLKQADSPVEVTAFKGANLSIGKISIRGNSLASPYGKDFVHYLQVALESELEKANLLKPGSSRRLTALIEENDIDASGFSVGIGRIKATFTVIKDTDVIYEKTITAEQKWESAFVGAVAIPRAAEVYPKLSETLLTNLYSDKQFISALTGP